MSSSFNPVDLDDVEAGPESWTANLVLNGLLLALGASVLALAFRTLDPEDQRAVHNPWTYVVLVPLAVLFLSTVLRTLVSRIVERSMQATFLLSVLVHLFILTYAGNVVIFSRAWPDLFDSLAEQRLQLKRESLQARQYVRMTSSSVSGQLPDYLRHVPSAHEPSEAAEANQSLSSQSKSEPSLMLNPEVELQPSETAHSMQRSKPQSEALEPFELQIEATPISLPRAIPETQPVGRVRTLETPPVNEDSPEQAFDASSAETNTARERRSVWDDLPGQSILSEVVVDSFTLEANSPGSVSVTRRDSQQPIPFPAEELSTPIIERSPTAGGVTGPAARSSQPTFGQSTPAVSEPQLESFSPLFLQARENRQRMPATSAPQLPDPGVARSPNWDNASSASSGISGRSPLQLARDSTEGEAAGIDVTNLTGSTGNIERTPIGLSRPPGNQASADGPSISDSIDYLAENSPPAASLPKPTNSGIDNDTLPPSNDSEFKSLAGDTAIRRSASRSRSGSVSKQLIEVGLPAKESSSSIQAPSDLIGQNESRDLVTDRQLASNSQLPGRRATFPELGLPGLESTRIERSQVIGSQGPSTQSAVAKPAFQQRLDRLSNRPIEQESAVAQQTELAIERGLEFLARHQRTDGSWRLQDFDTDVLVRSDTAATGLALLAFQGAGYTHMHSRYAKQMENAIQFLAGHQKSDGDLYIPQDPASDQNGWLYSHSIAALAMCEAYGMTQDERLRPVAQRAVDFMVSAQDPRRGGWRYRPGVGADTSVTGWFMMALKSGQLAGLNIPQKTFASIEDFVGNAQASSSDSHLYRYNPFALDTIEQRHGLRPTAVMTSVGLLMRLYMGWNREQPEMLRGASFLLDHAPQHGTVDQTLRDTYYWYYATQVIFHIGGDYWQRWQEALYPLLIEHQVAEGMYRGSWDPMQPVPDLWARYGGRLYVTTMNLLSLEVSYRHLPLYEAASSAPPAD